MGGPGRLDILAGRNIDFGAANGIQTTGNLNNPSLPTSVGTDLNVIAGMGSGWNVSDFIDHVVVSSPDAASDLISFVAQLQGGRKLKLPAAVAAFKQLKSEEQIPFVIKTFFEQLVASGREANSDPSKGYARGYDAIDALFPGSRAADNPYSGDINMLYSRIYTLSGGSINLLAPGGGLNVGLSAAPINVTQAKQPGQLGIVAQKAGDIDIFASQDVSVNSSRVQAG